MRSSPPSHAPRTISLFLLGSLSNLAQLKLHWGCRHKPFPTLDLSLSPFSSLLVIVLTELWRGSTSFRVGFGLFAFWGMMIWLLYGCAYFYGFVPLQWGLIGLKFRDLDPTWLWFQINLAVMKLGSIIEYMWPQRICSPANSGSHRRPLRWSHCMPRLAVRGVGLRLSRSTRWPPCILANPCGRQELILTFAVELASISALSFGYTSCEPKHGICYIGPSGYIK